MNLASDLKFHFYLFNTVNFNRVCHLWSLQMYSDGAPRMYVVTIIVLCNIYIYIMLPSHYRYCFYYWFHFSGLGGPECTAGPTPLGPQPSGAARVSIDPLILFPSVNVSVYQPSILYYILPLFFLIYFYYYLVCLGCEHYPILR